MRLAFLGETDDYGYMANFSAMINCQTEHISNAIVHTDNGGYDVDVVIKRKRAFGGSGYVDDVREMALDFLSQTEAIVINDTIKPIQFCYDFAWRKMNISGVIKDIPKYVFLQNVRKYYGNDRALISAYDEYVQYSTKVFTNQPFISEVLTEHGRACPFFSQPLMAEIPKSDTDMNGLLYRPYANVENPMPIVDMANFVRNERDDFDYQCIKKAPYRETRQELVRSNITLDTTARGVLGLPFYEGLYAGHHVLMTYFSHETCQILDSDGYDLRNVYAMNGSYLNLYESVSKVCGLGSPKDVTQEFSVSRFVRFLE